jgi:hypothetical protein
VHWQTLYIIKRARGPCEKGRDGGRRGQAPLGYSFCFFFLRDLLLELGTGHGQGTKFTNRKVKWCGAKTGRRCISLSLKSSFRSGPKFSTSVPVYFSPGALFEPNRGNIKETDFLAQTRFSSCPISERQNPISCPLMWTINCARPRDRPCPVAGFHVRFFSLLLWSDPASPQLGDPVSHSRVLRSRALFLSPPPSLVCSFLVLPLREIK